MKTKNFICANCGAEFEAHVSGSRVKKYCSKECLSKHFKKIRCGDANYNRKPHKNFTHTCETCSGKFKSYSKKARFCSRSCNGKRTDNQDRLKKLAPIAAAAPRKKRKKLGCRCVCAECGIEFRWPHIRKYCEKCSTYGKLHKDITCIVCGSKFDRKHRSNNRNTCSDKCLNSLKSSMQKGEKSHRWRGGKTSEAMIIRGSKEYADWRSSVFRRDKFTCQICGSVGGKLNADHIKPFSSHPELRLDVSNGRTLCVECHRKTDNFGAKAQLTLSI